jgi:hypothetical protein
LWAGTVAVGRSREPFMRPGFETGRFAIPFEWWFSRHEDSKRWIVGVPLWVPLPVVLLGLAHGRWRHLVYRTIQARHPAPGATP